MKAEMSILGDVQGSSHHAAQTTVGQSVKRARVPVFPELGGTGGLGVGRRRTLASVCRAHACVCAHEWDSPSLFACGNQ